MKKIYTYVAIFEYRADGINICFPDLPGCISCANTIEEGIYMAKDVLGLYLLDMKDIDIPIPTEFKKVVLKENQDKFIIRVEA